MQKKILSLILLGVLLLQISCFGTFTVSTCGFSTDYHPGFKPLCGKYPKNQYNETIEVNCAFEELVSVQRMADGRSPGIKSKIGPNGDYEIRFWHRDQIKALVPEYVNLISSRDKDIEKNEYKKRLLKAVNSTYSLDSMEEAEKITNKILDKFPFFRSKSISSIDWENVVSTVLESDITKWKAEHEEVVKQYKIDKCNWFENWFNTNSCQKKVDNEVSKILNENIRKEEIRRDVLASGFAQSVNSVGQGHHEEQDTLVARFDFSDDTYGARVYFTNIGLGKEKEIQDKDVKGIVDYLKGNNNGKEEL